MASHSNYSKCRFSDPSECFSCPYPDCVATMKDINRQEVERDRAAKIERNRHIIDLWNSGMPQKSIGERMNMSEFSVSHVISAARRNGKEVR